MSEEVATISAAVQRPATLPAIIETASTAAAAAAKSEIEAAYVVALNRPRNIEQVRVELLAACKRPGFAEAAIYRKPVGSKQVDGKWEKTYVEDLSIRAAEEAIRAMRNIRISSVTVYEDADIRKKKVTVTDLEANISYNREITLGKTVERRKPKDGQTVIGERLNSSGVKVFIVEATEDELTIKEAALTSKIIRTEGLRLVPSDIKEEAKEQCYATMRDRDAKDPKAAMRKVVDAFAGIGVQPAMLVGYLGHPLDQINPAELADLRKMYSAIHEGEATWSSFNAVPTAAKGTTPAPEAPRVAKGAAKKGKGKEPQAPNTDAEPMSEELQGLLAAWEFETNGAGTAEMLTYVLHKDKVLPVDRDLKDLEKGEIEAMKNAIPDLAARAAELKVL